MKRTQEPRATKPRTLRTLRPQPSKPLPASFYRRSTLEVARDLLGAVLFHHDPEGITAGRIVETEAYLCDDAACHAARGMTRRGTDKPKALCSGPGKLVIALGIAGLPNGSDLRAGPLAILPPESFPWSDASPNSNGSNRGNIKVTTRIGITKDADLPLRFHLEGNPFVSGK